MEYKVLFDKLKKSLNKGRVLILRNPKGDELDITNEMSDALLSWKMHTDRDEFERQMKIRDVQIYNLIDEIVECKKDLHRLRGVRKALDEKRLRYELFMSSKEGRMVQRLLNERIEDPDVEPYKRKMEDIKNTKIDEEDHQMSNEDEDKLRKDFEEKYRRQ